MQGNEYIALDITSISSYSQLLESSEWGYNRDHEELPQINLCMLFGEGSRLTIYQTSYRGSLKDVTTLRTTLEEVTSLVPDCAIRIVMDKGFYSRKNIDEMLNPDKPVHFLVTVPFTSAFAKKQIERVQKDIHDLDYTIPTPDGGMQGIHKVRTWHTDKRNTKLHVHIYLNSVRQVTERTKLYTYISFIALLLISELHQRMLRGGLYKTYTMHELLLKVRKLRVARLNGKRIVQPISKEQHEIFKALGFKDPVG